MGAMEISIIFDMKPFEAALEKLGGRLSGPIMADAMEKALTPMTQMARQLARRQSGTLARSIQQKVAIYKYAVVGIVGIDRNTVGEWEGKRRVPFNYAHLVEFGTAPHSLTKGDNSQYALMKRKAGQGG